MPAADVTYSFVIPVFDEEAVIPLLLERIDGLLAALDGPAEVIFVDDGSRDASAALLRARALADPRYRLLGLTRNFGHQVAITAGLEASRGAATIVMDADLQDPPDVVPAMIARWREGFAVVTARRLSRAGEGWFKRASAAGFYRLLERLASVPIARDTGDFRLVDRRALDAFLAMPERDRFVRGMFAWLGFPQAEVAFHRPPRALGETGYPVGRMLRLAGAGLLGFSDAPLRLGIWAGVGVSLAALTYGIYAVALKFAGASIDGWASIVVIVSFLCGANMLMTGLVGLYVGRIHAEVKRRPLYVVGARVGFSGEGAAPAASDSASMRAMSSG